MKEMLFFLNIYLVQVLQRQDDLGNVHADLVFSKALPLIKMRKQFAAAHVICRRTQTENDYTLRLVRVL